MPRLLPALVALALLALPATAMAQAAQTNTPAGNAAIDQYLETVPAATGNQRPPAPGGATAAGALTGAQRARLVALGPDGKRVAAVIDATSPARATSHAGAATPPTEHGRSPLGAVLVAASGRDGDGAGMGAVLPAILLATLLGVIALVVTRRRSVS